MLSDCEKQKIDAAFRTYGRSEAVVPEALMTVQEQRGWVSDEAIREIAEYLELTPEEVDGTATFYSLIFRRPVGRHVILICDSVSCWIMGYRSLREHLTEKLSIRLGETTADGRFTLLPSACLGACDMAPVMMVDRDLHGHLTPERIDAILEDYE